MNRSRHGTARSTETLYAAIDDVMSVLPVPDREEDRPPDIWQPAIFLELGGRLKPIDRAEAAAGHPFAQAARAYLDSASGRENTPVGLGLDGQNLIVRIAASARTRTSFVAVVSKDEFATFLKTAFPHLHVTPALRRLLVLHLAGVGLKDGAALDNRSVDTRKRQSQQLRAVFEADDLATVGRVVSNALVVALERFAHAGHMAPGQSIARYVDRYLPAGTRLYALSDRDSPSVPVLDMGPVDGQPVLTFHPMALPDIREQDIALLDDLGLRLIWPLRHGLCTPEARPLPPADHIEQALRDASLTLRTVCGGHAQVLAFAAASKLAIELARAQPAAVSRLHVAGVCVREGRPEAGPRRLARGVLALAASRPGLLDPILGQLETRLRKPGALERFMRRQFADSPADHAIIEAELRGPFGARRFRDALLDSAASARHDFLFQTDLEWDNAPTDVPVHLHHGEMDCIHPMALVEALHARLPNAVLHRHANVGQLFCHQHFRPLLTAIAQCGAR